MSALSVTASITVLAPADVVFEAVRMPVPFFVASASGPLTAGETVTWKFPEIDTPAPIIVESVVLHDALRFQWDAATGGLNTTDFQFAPLDAGGRRAAEKSGLDPTRATTVTITESGWPDTEVGRKMSDQNLMGWTHFLCALKCWIEHGKNLRTGAFLHFRF